MTGGTLCIDAENITVDLGAVGKGYALDYVKGILDTGNLKGAVVAVGGSVMVYGSKTDGSDFRVGIRNPKGAIDEMTGYLSFPGGSNICISTSGNYEKYFVVDGVRYHHILDRTTGYPAKSGLASVTVVCENGLYSDALSTACFVLGYEASLPLLEKYNAEAVFIDDDNGITVTEGLAGIYHDAD
jgi:thiamine biosynthesis lipoprotein